jgi:hypothetical protein
MNNAREEVMPLRPTVVSHVSWSSVFAGVVITMVVMFTLAILGMGIGLSSIQPQSQANPFSGLGTGSLIWWVIISIVSLFIGGWVSSRMAGIQRASDGALHGLVTWGVSTLVMVFFLTSTVGAVIGGGLGLVKNVAQIGGATGGAAAAANPGATRGAVNQMQQAIPNITNQAKNITPQQRQQMEAQARNVGGQVAKGAAAGAFGTFILLVLEGLAAAFGGAAGRNKGPVKV